MRNAAGSIFVWSVYLVLIGSALLLITSTSSRVVQGSAISACDPLPAPIGRIVNVSTEAELWNAVNENVPNTTILIANGKYNLGQNGYYLWLDTPNVTLRSASGDREAVILDDNYSGTEVINILASNVTITDLTIKRARTHPIHVMSSDSGDTLNTLIYNVHIIDPGQQAIKINPHAARVYFTDNGVIACSRLELTDDGRAYIWDINGSCYTGGVDAHWSRGWVVRDNVIEGFWCEQGLSEHAIHFWTGSRDTVIERNQLIDNARGIGFGLTENGSGRTYEDNPCPGAGGYVGHYNGIIRNNFVFASRSELFVSEDGFDTGVALWQACGAQVLHNTVVSTQAPFSSIEWRFSNTDINLVNNLVSHNLMRRNGASATLSGNLDYQPLTLFENSAAGDLHLASTAAVAIDQGVAVAAGLCDDDFDGETRPIGFAPDVGADEYDVSPPVAVTDLRLVDAVLVSDTLTTTLGWTAPTNAVTVTLRYASVLLTEVNWLDAVLLTNALPASVETFTSTVPYDGDTVYFALKSQTGTGDWSDVSNNAFWPIFTVHLPLVGKD